MDKWVVKAEEEGIRLLTYVKTHLAPKFSTKEVRWAIEHHRCKINGMVERFGSYRLKKGDKIEISLEKKPIFHMDPRILFEDQGFLLIDKPAGISSEELSSLLNLYIIHRLDRDTTGIFLLAKEKGFVTLLEALFRERMVRKSYLAIVQGSLPLDEEGIIENTMAKIGQREGEVIWGVVKSRGVFAKTEWKCLFSSQHFSLVRCHPFTGRTHQIRVHLSHLGYSILGDLQYGGRKSHPIYQPFRPLLHAESLEFVHPRTKQLLTVKAPLPDDFKSAFSSCFKTSVEIV